MARVANESRYEIPTIREENGECILEMSWSKYTIRWPKGKIYERRVYRGDEYRENQSFDNCLFDLLMGMEDALAKIAELEAQP